ncbi:MAG: helix-turn-helix transcriptional regulator [Lachnospiraceae bacterium]|nr:helix-turn-helix transcriptional regulator [Ruminococcus sp.]MCM1274719.1 helix-turn-helix transcriptional regulator [Lachnospiraceae bacterium]
MNRFDDTALKKEFGAIIRERRTKKQLTQEKLSEMTGITVVYLRDLENGVYAATWVIWLRLCTVLELDIPKFQKKYICPQLAKREKTLRLH